jgi:hypothetical protein
VGTLGSVSIIVSDSLNQDRELKQDHNHVNIRHNVGRVSGSILECQLSWFLNEFLSSGKSARVLSISDQCCFSPDGLRTGLDSWDIQAGDRWSELSLGFPL